MPQRGPRVSPVETVLLAGLMAWALFPLVLLLVHAGQIHARFTGADGLIGADGVLGADQLQYLAWARDASAHGGLASDLFSFSQGGHVYLQPLFAITGALYRLGLSLPLAYLLWKPLGVLALGLAAVAWARRFFADQLAARAAAVTISLFLCTPLAALYSWTQWASGSFRFSLYLLGDELLAADKLWGYVPSALGLALVPVALLATERALDPDRGVAGSRLPARRSPVAVRPLLLAALAALLASWLHPWQGITLGLIYVGLAVLRRLRSWAALAVPAIGAGLPLLYYYLLSHHDHAWKLASQYEVIARLPAIVLLAGFGPLALDRRLRGQAPRRGAHRAGAAAVGGRLRGHLFRQRRLRAPRAAGPQPPARGARRARLAPPAPPGGARGGRGSTHHHPGPGLQRAQVRPHHPQQQARAVLPPPVRRPGARLGRRHGPPGGVLAPTPFAAVVPSQTGRPVWVGHGYWSQDYPVQAREVDRLFGGRMSETASRAFVASTRATILVSDCRHAADLARKLGSAVGAVHQFGCARVYVLRRA